MDKDTIEDIKLRYYYELESSKSFEKDYDSFLTKVEQNGTGYKNLSGSYIDPDAVSSVKKISFYNHLTYFLNHQEKNQGKNKYLFLPPEAAPLTKQEKDYDIYKNQMDEKIITVVQVQDGERLFRLKSDQLGFSAAENKYSSNMPLARLLRGSQNSKPEERDKVKKRITQYVKNTRTVGGSFVWPVSLQGIRDFRYNMFRGQAPQEDRVDLTLLEIKHALDGSYDEGRYTSDKLYGQYCKEETCIKAWLRHFDSFEQYVKYFMFDSFVIDGMPVNIVHGEPLDDDYLENERKQYKMPQLQTLEVKEIWDMLERLEYMILNRSKKIENIIKQYI